MSEIIYSKTTEQNRSILDQMKETGRIALDVKTTVWRSDRKVSVVTSRLLSGRPRTAPDKRYYQWRTIASHGFYRTATGLAAPYQCSRPETYKVGTPWSHSVPTLPFKHLAEDSDAGASEAFRRAMRETFHVRTAEDIYPMMRDYDLPTVHHIPHELRMAFRKDSHNEFAHEVFGVKRCARLPFNQAVQDTEAYYVAMAHQFRGLVPDRAIYNFMYDTEFDDEMEEDFPNHSPRVRNIIRILSQDQREAILNRGFDLLDARRVQRLSQVNLTKSGYTRKQITESGATSWAELFRSVNGGRDILDSSGLNW